MNENNTQATVEAPKLSREERLANKIASLKKRIEDESAKVVELEVELANINLLANIAEGSQVVVKLGRKFADKDTTRYVNGEVIGVKEDENGSKLYKVCVGTGFDTDVVVVNGSALSVPVPQEGEVSAE